MTTCRLGGKTANFRRKRIAEPFKTRRNTNRKNIYNFKLTQFPNLTAPYHTFNVHVQLVIPREEEKERERERDENWSTMISSGKRKKQWQIYRKKQSVSWDESQRFISTLWVLVWHLWSIEWLYLLLSPSFNPWRPGGSCMVIRMAISMLMMFVLVKGCVTVLDIVFVGQCEVFVCLDFVHVFFLPLGRKAHRSSNGLSVLWKMSNFPTPTPLKHHSSIWVKILIEIDIIHNSFNLYIGCVM